jgi:hypothetical protein
MGSLAETGWAGESWQRFAALVCRNVQEGNQLAGDRLWAVWKPPGRMRLVVRSLRRGVLVRCSWAESTSTLTVVPAAEAAVQPMRFVVSGTAASKTIEQAISAIFDAPIWTEDTDGAVAGKAQSRRTKAIRVDKKLVARAAGR